MGLFPTTHFVLVAFFFGAVWIGFQARQVLSKPPEQHSSWNFSEKPSPDSTSHLIFDTVNSFLQHWTNTRYRNGHNIVPGTVPIGTLLYHGTFKEEIPRSPEWTATDPEHSYIFCHGRTPEDSGCWQLTLVTTRPLRVLYFDGSSAAKFPGGSMDSQDVLMWGEVKPDWTFEEVRRINDLCEWGKQYGIDGFVRMEMDFEVMLCDFSAGVQVVSFNHLIVDNIGRQWKDGIHEPFKLPMNFRVIEAGRWHNYFPGETRIHLNYAGVVSFYDTALFPSLKVLRSNKERWDHRLQGIDSKDVETFLKTVGSILDGAWDRPVSGIDWKAFLRTVMDRYVGRLQVLNTLLNSTEAEVDPMLTLKKAHSYTSGMLSPYRLYSAYPPNIQPIPNHSWAIPVFEECATTHTRYIDSNPFLSQSLTYSEHLLLNSTKSVSKEICRVIVGMWAEGIEHGILKEGFACPAQELVIRWKKLSEELMAWLDWSEWVTCQPGCGDEEICYLPTWPFFTGRPPPGPRPPLPPGPRPPPPPGRFYHLHLPLGHSNISGDRDWAKPQPRCIQRIS